MSINETTKYHTANALVIITTFDFFFLGEWVAGVSADGITSHELPCHIKLTLHNG